MVSKAADAFKQEFIARIKQARAGIAFTQQQMATALGITQDTYKQYEGRSLLPYHLVAQFCAITRKSEAWLFTGRETKRVVHALPPIPERASPRASGGDDGGPRKKHRH